jgi:hypothetical protein
MIDSGDRAVDLGEVAYRHWDPRCRYTIVSKPSAPPFAETFNSLVHDLALLVRFVGIKARYHVLDLSYGRHRQ